jgi:hypothetical protein
MNEILSRIEQRQALRRNQMARAQQGFETSRRRVDNFVKLMVDCKVGVLPIDAEKTTVEPSTGGAYGRRREGAHHHEYRFKGLGWFIGDLSVEIGPKGWAVTTDHKVYESRGIVDPTNQPNAENMPVGRYIVVEGRERPEIFDFNTHFDHMVSAAELLIGDAAKLARLAATHHLRDRLQ